MRLTNLALKTNDKHVIIEKKTERGGRKPRRQRKRGGREKRKRGS